MPGKFTSGQYKQMAEILLNSRPNPKLNSTGDLYFLQWKDTVEDFCKGLGKLNPRFKPHLFKKVAGLEEEDE